MRKPSTEDRLIQEELRDTHGNLSKVARVLGLDYHMLKARYGADQQDNIFKPVIGPEPDDITTLGRNNLNVYVVAIKRAGSGWPRKYDDTLKKARELYDAGTHEMFQSSERGWVVQYLMPRRKAVARREYFSSQGKRL